MATMSNGTPTPKQVPCAIYTRKSTEVGLNQEFNSLDAQREAAEVHPQPETRRLELGAHPVQRVGYTGANMERPAVKQLLADIEARNVDCVVVYKARGGAEGAKSIERVLPTVRPLGEELSLS